MFSVSLMRPATTAAPLRVRMLSTSSLLLKKKNIDSTLPAVPKGPPTPYTLWFKDHIASVSEKYRRPDGKLDMRRLTNEAATEWASLSSSVKAELQSRADEGKKLADKAYLEFWNSTTPETRSAIEKATGKKVSPPGGKKAFKQSVKERPGNPGKPLTPYFAFAKEVRDGGKVDLPSDLEGNVRNQQLAKETGALWKQLSDSEKQRYKDAYVQARAKWDEWRQTQPDL
ncbi:hypothetical protein J008_02248 [Cryptococcus neoformans]|nr:hypothetical protein C367_02185 [Cryptococcus neoformans var. grubii Ze90-1]OXH37194.1 hypothetical protein J008_02248 [Cryptococcus neoformans var. grubii]